MIRIHIDLDFQLATAGVKLCFQLQKERNLTSMSINSVVFAHVKCESKKVVHTKIEGIQNIVNTNQKLIFYFKSFEGKYRLFMIAFSVVSPADLSLAEDFSTSVPQSCLSIAAMEGVLPRLCAGRLIPALTSSKIIGLFINTNQMRVVATSRLCIALLGAL